MGSLQFISLTLSQTMERSFMAAESEMLLVLAASKVTSWAAASCSHETTSWTGKVRGKMQLQCHSLKRFVCPEHTSVIVLKSSSKLVI